MSYLEESVRLILGCAAGQTNTGVAHELRLTKHTVSKWRRRLAPDAQTLEATPADATHRKWPEIEERLA